MGAGSSVNIERVQIQNGKLVTTNMSVVPIRIGELNTNLQTVHRSEGEIPKGSLTDSEYAMLPLQTRTDMAQNNVYTAMNRETRRNPDSQELIDMSEEGVIRATGDGVLPIVQILNSMNRRNIHKYEVINEVDSESRQFHLRASPFGRMVNPLFETGERIHSLSHNMQERENKFKPIPESEIEQLETVKDKSLLNEDCSICLDELNKNDIPEQKYMLNSKNTDQIKQCLKERGVRFNADTTDKGTLIDILWNNRKVPNYQWKVKRLSCGHLFHANCLKSWFKNKDSCPNCRFKFQLKNTQ